MVPTDPLLPALLAFLALVAVVDARRGIIPDAANAAIAALGLFHAAGAGWDVLLWHAFDALVVASLLLALREAYRRRRGLVGLGLGDVKLLAAATLWLGMAALSAALFLASFAALAYLGFQALRGHAVGRQTRLRFGPFLAPAIAVCALLGPLPVGLLS